MTGRSRRQQVLAALLLALAVGSVVTVAAAQQTQTETRPADLAIEQPHYIQQSVSEQGGQNATLYEIAGPTHRIYPQNFDAGQVTDFRVEGPGSLSYNAERDYFRFDAEANGTVTAVFTVREQREVVQNNSTTTEAVQVEYRARLRVSQVNTVHKQQSEFQQIERDADNWTALVDEIQKDSVAGPDADVEAELQTGVNWIKFTNNPAQVLSGDFGATLTILVLSVPGLLILLISLTGHVLIRRSEIGFVNRVESIRAERGRAEEVRDEVERKERQQEAASWRWTDIDGLPDPVAREFHEEYEGEALDGILETLAAHDAFALLHARLTAMGTAGYVARVEGKRPLTDGGRDDDSDDGDGDDEDDDMMSITVIDRIDIIKEQDVTEEDRESGTVEIRDLTDLSGPDDPLVRAMDPGDDALWDEAIDGFDLSRADMEEIDLGQMEAPDMEALTERFIDQYDRLNANRETYGRFLQEWLAFADTHAFTTDGQVDNIRLAQNVVLRLGRELSEKQGLNWARMVTEHVEWALHTYDEEEATKRVVEDIEMGRYASAGD